MILSWWFHVIPWVGKNKVVKLVTMHESHRSDSTNSSVFFLYSRAKNRQYDIGMRFYKTMCVSLMTKKWLGTTHPSARSGYGMEEITSGTTRNDREPFNKIFEEISLGRARDWVVSVRLGAAGDRMQSVFYSGSRHAPFFLPFFPSIWQSQGIFLKIWILNLTSKRLLWFQHQWLYSDNTNDHSHYLAFLPAPPQHSIHILRYIFSSGFTLESKSLHSSSNRFITFWSMPVRMKMWWTRSV